MDIDNLTIGDAKRLAAMFGGQATPPAAIPGHNRPVIVRSRDAGVQYGYLSKYEGSTVYLTSARQMWNWMACEGGTLLDCATHGVKGGKFSNPADVIVIGACAIIDVSEKAKASLESMKWA